MNVGFYTASSGVKETQKALDNISNNIANVQTVGFKELRSSFSDLLYTVRNENNPDVQTGHGTKVAKTDLMFKIGQLMPTNRSLDFATPTEGLFAVQDENGNVFYTKAGNFYLKENGEQWDLVNAEGLKVLDYDMNAITVDFISEGEMDVEGVYSSLGVFSFDNPYGLLCEGGNLFRATESSGEATANRELAKLSGALEMSTTDLSEQMVKLIEVQRAFQFNSKLVQTNDEIQSIVNNLRR